MNNNFHKTIVISGWVLFVVLFGAGIFTGGVKAGWLTLQTTTTQRSETQKIEQKNDNYYIISQYSGGTLVNVAFSFEEPVVSTGGVVIVLPTNTEIDRSQPYTLTGTISIERRQNGRVKLLESFKESNNNNH